MHPVDKRGIASNIYQWLRSLRKAANVLKVAHSTVARWLKCPDRKRYSRKCPKSTPAVAETIRAALLCNPIQNAHELRTLVQDTLGVTISDALVRVAIKRLGFSREPASTVNRGVLRPRLPPS